MSEEVHPEIRALERPDFRPDEPAMTQDIKTTPTSDPRLDEWEKLAARYSQLATAEGQNGGRAGLHAYLDERSAALALAEAARDAIPALIAKLREAEARATAAEARVAVLEKLTRENLATMQATRMRLLEYGKPAGELSAAIGLTDATLGRADP
jgi:hypothetical protein